MTSQFFSHGFAIYVRWEGNHGKDQNGYFWTIRGGWAICVDNEDLKFKL